jgi:hypothetical protein
MSEERVAEGDDVDDLGIIDDLLGPPPEDPDDELGPESQPTPGSEEPEQNAPASRANRTIRAMQARLKAEADEKAQLRRQIDQLLSQTRPPPAPPPDPYLAERQRQQEQERLAMMQPHEIAAYTEQKLRTEFNGTRLQDQVTLRDEIDRLMFGQLKTRDKLAERFSDQVETLLISARQQGMNPSREIILNALVGQEVRQKAQRQADGLRRRGARQIAAQTTQPGAGRSTAPASGNRRQATEDSDEAMMERLRNTTLGEAWRLGTG